MKEWRAGIWSNDGRCFNSYPVENQEEAAELVKTLKQPAFIHALINQKGEIIYRPSQKELEKIHENP